jgi:hypothetical protein
MLHPDHRSVDRARLPPASSHRFRPGADNETVGQRYVDFAALVKRLGECIEMVVALPIAGR